MKLFIAFLICIVAVSGGKKNISNHDSKIYAMLREAGQTCVQEMKIDLSLAYNFDEEACLKACVHKKMGVLKEDGTYNFEHILSVFVTSDLKRPESILNNRVKECFSKVGEDRCKMAACIDDLPTYVYMKNEWR